MRILRSWLSGQVRIRHNLFPYLLLTESGQGQSGLAVGARLGQLGVSTLIIDKNGRIGDNWRNRYRVRNAPVMFQFVLIV